MVTSSAGLCYIGNVRDVFCAYELSCIVPLGRKLSHAFLIGFGSGVNPCAGTSSGVISERARTARRAFSRNFRFGRLSEVLCVFKELTFPEVLIFPDPGDVCLILTHPS